eukprot:TRINITY_DN33814_c0_g1_i1.p1 TRINITY_DN33814_c0_g1~~TRINITY_DN33814_c0_g1_i1.p1  ORF type:complete len:456 (+),score=72.50 TRINITY_DN33814_c0_g1_i1:23-1390(+)
MSLPSCPPPSDASLGSIQAILDDASRGSAHSSFHPISEHSIEDLAATTATSRRRTRQPQGSRGGFRLKGFHAIVIGILMVSVLGAMMVGVVSLITSQSGRVNEERERIIEDLKGRAKQLSQEKTDLQFVVDSCHGETGDLRSSLDSAVEEQEKLKDAVHSAEFEAWSTDDVMLAALAVAILVSILCWVFKPFPKLPSRLSAGDVCEVYLKKTDSWHPAKVLSTSTKDIVVQLTDDISTIHTTVEWYIRKVVTTIKHVEIGSLPYEKPATPKPCEECPALLSDNMRLQEIAARHSSEMTRKESETRILTAELEATKQIVDLGSSDKEKVVMYEKEIRELRVAEKMASSSYKTTLDALEDVRRQYDKLVNKREDDSMLRTEEIVSLATRELDGKLARESRRRKDSEAHSAHLQCLLQSSSEQISDLQTSLKHSEATSAVASAKFLSALSPKNPSRRL